MKLDLFAMGRSFSGKPLLSSLGLPVAEGLKFFMKGSAVAAYLLGNGSLLYALQVTPGRTEIRLSPGKNVHSLITVTNDLPGPITVDRSTKDWFVLDLNKPYGVATWLKVKGPEHFALKAGESRKVSISVTCPKDAQGELVGMVSFAYHEAQPSMVTPMISVSVYTSVAGTEHVAGSIQEVDAVTFQGQLHIGAVVLNSGNVHLRPTGKITILNAQNQPLASYPVAESDPTYPGHERGYSCALPSIKLEPGRYTAQAELTYKDLVMKGQNDFTVQPDGQVLLSHRGKTSKS